MSGNNNNAAPSDIYSSEMVRELDRRNKAVRFAITRMDVDIEKASVNLYWIYSTKAYRAMGHESIMDYALAEFDISKSTTYNYITLAERFGRRDENGSHLYDGFDEKYKQYSSSKLNLLAPLTDDEIGALDIAPEMSVRDIKKKIKRAKDGYEMVYLPADRFRSNADSLSGDNTARTGETSPDASPGSEPSGHNIPVNFSYYIDEIVNGRVVDCRLWKYINTQYIYDTLKYHPEKSLLIRSYESEPYLFDEEKGETV